MKTALKFIALLSMAVGAFAQQGQMASSFTASSDTPHFTLNRATTAQESSVYFKTAGATTGGWRIYGSGITNQVLNFYSYQAGVTVGSLSSTGLAVTGNLSLSGVERRITADFSNATTSSRTLLQSSTVNGSTGIIAIPNGSSTNAAFRLYSSSDTLNADIFDFALNGSVSQIRSYSVGTGTAKNIELSVDGVTIGTFSSAGLAVTYSGASGNNIQNSSDSSGTIFVRFNKASGTAIGSITRVTTTDAVTYNTTSDGRLKENLRDFTGADSGPIIDGLRPRWFDWVNSTDGDGENAVGFVAQEMATVDPLLARIGAVTCGDDDPEVITKQWQRSDAALIPILVAEIQALRARVAALEALNNPTP